MNSSSKQKNNTPIVIGGILVVAIVFILLIIFSTPKTSTYNAQLSKTNTTGEVPAAATIVNDVTNVPESVLNAIGTGTATNGPRAIKAPALIANNKPEIFYEGAEYCPYCATERWAVTVALSKFGTFTNLGQTHSSSSDVYPNTQTLSFYKSTYTSNYITFTPIEAYTNIPDSSGGYTTLQTPTAAENNLVNKYDAAPYLPSQDADAIPFIDFGGKYLIAGATYSPTVLQGKSALQIASSLDHNNNPIADGADGAANTIIATICKLTNNLPKSTCTPLIKSIEAHL
jgi:hypothetical protein